MSKMQLSWKESGRPGRWTALLSRIGDDDQPASWEEPGTYSSMGRQIFQEGVEAACRGLEVEVLCPDSIAGLGWDVPHKNLTK